MILLHRLRRSLHQAMDRLLSPLAWFWVMIAILLWLGVLIGLELGQA